MDDTPFLPAHCRAARALLEMTQEELAKVAEVGRMTVKRFEASEGVRSAQVKVIRDALEAAGIVFLVDCSIGSGRRVDVGVGFVQAKAKR